jgi:hypothetical protein
VGKGFRGQGNIVCSRVSGTEGSESWARDSGNRGKPRLQLGELERGIRVVDKGFGGKRKLRLQSAVLEREGLGRE